MRADKLTNQFQLALSEAQSKAIGQDNQFIEPVHVLTAMLEQANSGVGHLLANSGVDLNQLNAQCKDLLARLPRVQGSAGDVHPSNDLVRVFNLADKNAQKRADDFISSELFVLALLESDNEAGKILERCGASVTNLNAAIDAVRGGQSVQDPNAEDNRQALEKYTIDLTASARSGKLDPVIGRDEEIRRTIQVSTTPNEKQSGADWRTRRR